MKKMNSSGFSAVEALLVIVILGILGFSGWFVWNAKQNTDKTFSATATSSSPVTKKKPVAKPAAATTSTPDASMQPATHTQADADTLVTATYKTYISKRQAGANSTAALPSVKDNFTTAEYDRIVSNKTGTDQLICASNYVPDGITTNTTVSGSTATTIVTRITNGQTASTKITVSVELPLLKIAKVTCPS